ncbi:MAG: PIN domain-containing protein, partial [Lacisediminimonas sp.]|nr:PIN domain-containing protein [Lacisediminimonas sp.]
MPLPKIPAKPAVILAPSDYPKAEKGKPVKPSITLIDSAPSARAVSTPAAIAPAASAPAVRAPVREAQVPALLGKAPEPSLDAATAVQKPLKTVEMRPKSSVSRAADRSGKTKLFVLDTNVLMHDPSSLFRFAEHDVYLPMMTLEELDNHKKGMSEVARNARQVSRSMDALVADIDDKQIDSGIPLSKLGNKDARGCLFFQTSLQPGELPEGLPQGKADNQILAVVRALQAQHPGRAVVLVSKDINMRIKARAMALPAEEYFNDHVLEDTDLLYSGILQLPNDFWNKHGKGMESWQENKHGTGYTY